MCRMPTTCQGRYCRWTLQPGTMLAALMQPAVKLASSCHSSADMLPEAIMLQLAVIILPATIQWPGDMLHQAAILLDVTMLAAAVLQPATMHLPADMQQPVAIFLPATMQPCCDQMLCCRQICCSSQILHN